MCALFSATKTVNWGTCAKTFGTFRRETISAAQSSQFSLILFWTDQNPREATFQLPLESMFVPLSHGKGSRC